MVNTSGLNSNSINSSSKDEEFDLKLFFNFLRRNVKILTLISIISIFSGYLLSFLPKRTWEGQFQIVLTSESDNNNSFSSIAPSLEVFTGGNAANNLRTEVGILRSPSTLMPAFEIYLSKNDNFSNNHYDFSQWKRNLTIELEKGTSILNISYRDQEKDNILPILQKMSSTYQKYSGIRKQKKNEINQEYLEEQIKLFSRQSSISLKRAQEYAIDQDLIYYEINPLNNSANSQFSTLPTALDLSMVSSNNPTSTFLPLNDSVERVRVEASNEINKIDLTLKKLGELNEEQSLEYVGSTIPELVKSDFLDTLQKIEADIVQAKSKYTQEDVSVKRLLEKRKLVNQQLKERAINYLKSKKLDAEAKLEASTRPKDVLIKYKELIRNAKRDEITLIKLEEQLRGLVLNKARKEEPWELITKPSLLNKPVDNTKLAILIISLFGGLVFGSAYLLLKEKESGIIFELKDLIQMLPEGFVEIISTKDIESLEDNIIYLKEFINNESNQKINLITLGDIEKKDIQIFRAFLTKKQNSNTNIELIDSIVDIKNETDLNNNFLLLEFGSVTYSQINTFKKYKKLFNLNTSGTIILNNNTKQ